MAGRSSARRRQTRVECGKQAIFEQNATISRKQQEIRPKLPLMTNWNLHMRFPFAPRLMNLYDLNCCKFEYSENFAGFRRFGKQRMKVDPYSQRQRCNPLNVLFNIVPCIDIAIHFFAGVFVQAQL